MHCPKVLAACFVLAILSGCVFGINQKADLSQEIALWQNFRLEGIVKIYQNNLNIIKDITIIRDSTELKAVVYEAGLFGLSPRPLARIVIADSIELDLPVLENNQSPDFSQEFLMILECFKDGIISKEALKSKTEIKKQRKLSAKDKTLFFDDQLRLNRIDINDLRIEIDRNYQGSPENIAIYHQKKLAATIEIDKFYDKDN